MCCGHRLWVEVKQRSVCASWTCTSSRLSGLRFHSLAFFCRRHSWLFGYVILFIFPFFPAACFIFVHSQSINQSTFICTVLNHIQSRFETALYNLRKKNTWASEQDVTVAGKNSPVRRNFEQIPILAGHHLPATFPQGNKQLWGKAEPWALSPALKKMEWRRIFHWFFFFLLVISGKW